MSGARWGDPREYGGRDIGVGRPRVYDERDSRLFPLPPMV